MLDADLLRAVTLAVQSLDPNTLNIIKRKNINLDEDEALPTDNSKTIDFSEED